MEWTRREALRTPAFWLIVTTFGVAHIGVSGLNLHVFSFVSDQGHPATVAALVMSTIAIMQFSTPIVWGLCAERMDIGRVIMAKFVIQAAGIENRNCGDSHKVVQYWTDPRTESAYNFIVSDSGGLATDVTNHGNC